MNYPEIEILSEKDIVNMIDTMKCQDDIYSVYEVMLCKHFKMDTVYEGLWKYFWKVKDRSTIKCDKTYQSEMERIHRDWYHSINEAELRYYKPSFQINIKELFTL